MKRSLFFVLLMILALLLSACSEPDGSAQTSSADHPGFTDSSTESLFVEEGIMQRCMEITALYYDLYACAEKTQPQNPWDDPLLSQSTMDSIEQLLIDAGLDVMDTHGTYPGYLASTDHFDQFWEDANQGKFSSQEIIAVCENGSLFYRLFTCRDGAACLHSMVYPMEEDSPFQYEVHEVLEWELTDRGNFYYRIHPADNKHYSDFFLIRTTKPDPLLYDLTIQYISAGGYLGTNLFLTDWAEGDWGGLSFNDLWEYLFSHHYGEPFLPDGYESIPEQDCCKIPAEEFEEVVLPYFHIDLDTFRSMAQYNPEGDYYPWRPIQTNDFVFLYYYTVEPEVTGYSQNPDGTITLTVEMLSTDLKVDCLFAHEVTVRPLQDGSFQYVSNKVTYQTEYGLPFCKPRLTWGTSK